MLTTAAGWLQLSVVVRSVLAVTPAPEAVSPVELNVWPPDRAVGLLSVVVAAPAGATEIASPVRPAVATQITARARAFWRGVEWAPSLIPSNPPTTIHNAERNGGLPAPIHLFCDSPGLAPRKRKRCIPMAFPRFIRV